MKTSTTASIARRVVARTLAGMIRGVASRVGGGRTHITVLFVVLMVVCAIFVGRQLLLQRPVVVARQSARWSKETGRDGLSRRRFIVEARLTVPHEDGAAPQPGGDHA